MSARNAIVVARELIVRHGTEAASVVDRRVQENTQLGDQEAASFWRQVSQAVRALRSELDSTREKPVDVAFRPVFEATPHPYLLLTPDLKIADANDAYLSVTMTRLSDIVGCGLFEVFPDNPDQPEADGVRNLAASLDRGRPDRMRRQRYDIRRPDGRFEERWWDPLNIPVFDDEGRMALILHHVEDVTCVRQRDLAA